MAIDPQTPILIGVGQTVSHWKAGDAQNAVKTAPSAISLAVEASKAALEDTGAADKIAAAIDAIAMVRTNADNIAGTNQPFGKATNPPASIAAGLGLAPKRKIYSTVGGDQPQFLVNEFAEEIFAGRTKAALLTGAEATAAFKEAKRARLQLDWTDDQGVDFEDRGLGKRQLNDYEIANGVGFPTWVYPLFENALRVRWGSTAEEHRQTISELWSGFSKVAANNPYSQFPVERSVEFLSERSRENYHVSGPYNKWDVAQDAVNQAATVILTSVATAQELGVPENKWIYLHGYGQASDKLVSERADLSRSQAMELVLDRALKSSGKTKNDISVYDLYSCFPCAVLIAAEAIGVDFREQPLTVTGGLPFFGGPGNNYSMHGLASMAEILREKPGEFGLVLANGGFLTKEAAGVYSTTPKDDWAPISSKDLQETIDNSHSPKLLNESGEAEIETYTVGYIKGRPTYGYAVCKKGEDRIIAKLPRGHVASMRALAAKDHTGAVINIEGTERGNVIRPAGIGTPANSGPIARNFEFAKVERNGHLLEVTLNRPENMNALHGPAHYELHEIWDEFERDQDLWVGIITGAGERAFCSGNDLKNTNQGGDMSTPRSGFAGFCSRYDRTKPVIAAVNGVAMGGGMEIALACDLIVAEEGARFALPEVKVGLFAGAGGVQRLTRQIDRKQAMDLILTGRHIFAEEAKSLGIVNEVCPDGQALTAARAYAETILANSPSAIRASKRVLNQLDGIESIKEGIDLSGPEFGKLLRTKDAKEGVAAFVEKRAPNWRNE
jgi:acetyl-CoA C-acetyltransferase